MTKDRLFGEKHEEKHEEGTIYPTCNYTKPHTLVFRHTRLVYNYFIAKMLHLGMSPY